MQLLEIAQVPDEHVSYYLYFWLCYFNLILESICTIQKKKEKRKEKKESW